MFLLVEGITRISDGLIKTVAVVVFRCNQHGVCQMNLVGEGTRRVIQRPKTRIDEVEFARTRLGFRPDERQAEVLRSTVKRGILNCSRQWGKSTVTVAKALYRVFSVPESLVLVSSPSKRQA